jgi:long-subunit fatty acid transport protein
MLISDAAYGRSIPIQWTVALVFLCLLLVAVPAMAYYDEYVAPISEVPLTTPNVVGARSLGMGGVCLAIVDDASALTTNPAALARLRRMEVAGGLAFRGRQRTGSAFGSDFDTSVTTTDISSLRFAYPFPTFRGSLVVGLSVDEIYDLADDFLISYEDSIGWNEPSGDTTSVFMEGPWDQTEDRLTDGGIYGLTFGVAFDASERVSLGAAVSYLYGEYDADFVYTADDVEDISDAYESYSLRVQSESDVSGLRFRMGTLFYLSESLSAGLVVETPAVLKFHGYLTELERAVGPEGWEFTETHHFEDEIGLPFTFGAGVAWNPTDLIALGLDYHYANWSEMTYAGRIFLGDQAERERAYAATSEFRIGAEVTIPNMPLRLRAGYMTRPVAYQGLEIDQDRAYYTLGAGILIDTVFTIDVAWISGVSERSGADYDYNERIEDSAVVVEAAYHF